MRVDLTFDINPAIAGQVSNAEFQEYFALVLSCIEQGKPKGVAMHPGITIDWKLTLDKDGGL